MKINGEAVSYLVEASANKEDGYREDGVPEPQSWYAKTKYEGEN